MRSGAILPSRLRELSSKLMQARDRSLGVVALITVTLVWGTTFAVTKELTAQFSALWIVVLRFSIAAVLLAPWLHGCSRADLVSGVLLGLPLYGSFVFQIDGLAGSTASRNAFVYGLNALMVPLLGLAARETVRRQVFVAILLALTGLMCLCWKAGPWTRGDNLALLGALSFAVYIRLMDKRVLPNASVMSLTAIQLVTVAVCAAFCLAWRSFSCGPLACPAVAGADAHAMWLALRHHATGIAYLGGIATAAVIALQAWGQGRVSANEAASIYAFEPAAAAVFSCLWLGERLDARAWVGIGLLLLGIAVCQWSWAPARPRSSGSAGVRPTSVDLAGQGTPVPGPLARHAQRLRARAKTY
jgi:drug/metabolite transporter (DMT)-like permease